MPVKDKFEAETYNQLMVCLGWYDAIEMEEILGHEEIVA